MEFIKERTAFQYQSVLFVCRSATKKEIMRSYRKLAVQWHPDHYEGDDKKKAEKMFIDIAAAKEVLSWPWYDNLLDCEIRLKTIKKPFLG